MLEDFIPAAAERLRAAPMGAHLDAFCASLLARGYCAQTIREKLLAVGRLSRWMTAKRLDVVDLDERCVSEFVTTQRRRGVRSTLLQLLEQLRAADVLPMPVPVRDDSPAGVVLATYAQYLHVERGLVASTIKGYLVFVSQFVGNHLRDETTRLDSLRTHDVREFLLNRVRHLIPKRAQFLGTALRSFLRFLFLRGEISSDLSLAVPAVRQAYLVSVPRHLPSEEVEQLLASLNFPLQVAPISGSSDRNDRGIPSSKRATCSHDSVYKSRDALLLDRVGVWSA